MENQEKAYAWAKALCQYAKEDEAFLQQFWNKMQASLEVYKEFLYYLEHQDFLCEYQCAGCTIIDIMIWQVDHFKKDLDMGLYDMRENGDKMLLMAFNTMLDMEKNPDKYITRFQGDTGSDYPGKF